jgi:hypothetical protein
MGAAGVSRCMQLIRQYHKEQQKQPTPWYGKEDQRDVSRILSALSGSAVTRLWQGTEGVMHHKRHC